MAINFPIVTTFDDKAIKRADRAFSSLGKTFLGVFSVAKVVQFGKASIKAFSDAEQEARLLAAQLNSINLGFSSPYINEYIDKLSLATGIAGRDLTNAFVTLSQATGDVTTAQKILNTALDVSLGTGKDLQTVSLALQRAYKGETTALAKLRIGLTNAELKGKDFDTVLTNLQARFEGSAAAATETFAVKMARLTEAVDQAKEAFGEGLVSGLQDSQIEVERLQQNIINLGNAMGATAAMAVSFSDKLIAALARVSQSSAAAAVLSLFEKLTNYVVGPIVFGTTGKSFSSADAARAGEARRMSEKAASAGLRALNARTRVEAANTRLVMRNNAAQAKGAAQRLASEKKITKEKNKQNRESKIIDELNKRFEIDRIQIAAALGGKINEVERLRLELMQALLDEDVKRALLLEGQLIKAEAAASELALLLDSLDTMVGDPFADWPATINRIQDLLKQLNIKIPIETLFAEKGLKLDQKTMTVTTIERMDVAATSVYINGTLMNQNPTLASTGQALSADVWKEFTAGNPLVVAAVENAAAANSALADAELLLAQSLLAESGGTIEINVNVEGSVISEGDLAETLINELYRNQRNGQGILVSSVAI